MLLSKTSTFLSLRRIALVRAYTVVPYTPQQSPLNEQPTKQEELNSIHALYNNQNQSLQEHYSSVQSTYRSLSEDDTFGPSFNTVFDE
jgi:hypothetical protein